MIIVNTGVLFSNNDCTFFCDVMNNATTEDGALSALLKAHRSTRDADDDDGGLVPKIRQQVRLKFKDAADLRAALKGCVPARSLQCIARECERSLRKNAF